MMSDTLEQLRKKLNTRYISLVSSDFQVFHAKLKQYWGFLNAHPICVEAIEGLEYKFPEIKSEVNTAYEAGILTNRGDVKPFYDNEISHVAMSLFVIKLCAESEDLEIETKIGLAYSLEGRYDAALKNGFSKRFIEPFNIFLDELLSQQSFVLSFLLRYKQRCEWFDRESLFKLWKNAERQTGEKKLRTSLLKYLHDQGFTLREEPVSASGEVDLIATDTDGEELFIETKVFNTEKNLGKNYIVRGFVQTFSYLEDYNASVGYIVLYKTGITPLMINFSENFLSVPFVTVNNKTVFAMIIDIASLPPASKRKPLPSVTITEGDIDKQMEESDDQSDDN